MGSKFIGAGLATIALAGAGVGIGSVFSFEMFKVNLYMNSKLFRNKIIIIILNLYY
jgi:hypothetical protein